MSQCLAKHRPPPLHLPKKRTRNKTEAVCFFGPAPSYHPHTSFTARTTCSFFKKPPWTFLASNTFCSLNNLCIQPVAHPPPSISPWEHPSHSGLWAQHTNLKKGNSLPGGTHTIVRETDTKIGLGWQTHRESNCTVVIWRRMAPTGL